MIVFIGLHKSNTLIAEESNLQTQLKDEFSSIDKTLKGENSIANLQNLNLRYHDIYIYKSDSIIYWNNYTSPVSIYEKSAKDFPIRFKTINGNYKIIVGLDMSPNGKVRQLLSKVNSEFEDQIEFERLILKDFSNKNYNYSLPRQTSSSSYNTIASILFLLSFIFILRFITFSFDQINSKSLIAFFVALGIVLIYHLALKNVFSDSELAIFSNDLSTLNSSLLDVFTNLIGFVFILYYCIPKIIADKKSSPVYQILTVFGISSLFIYTAFLSKGFLFSKPLNTISDVLQFNWNGLIYIISFIIIISIIHFISLKYFRSENQQSSKKYIYYILGLLLSIPLGFFLKIDIPFWTLIIFTFSYLLILDMYLENQERNLIFTFWWLIIFSGFLASITYYYLLDYSEQKIVRQLNDIYKEENQDANSFVVNVDQELKSSKIFSQLSELPYPSGLDHFDYQSYLSDVIFSDKERNFQIEVEAADSEGITLFNNHFNNYYQYNKSILSSEKLTQHIFYNPFIGAYFLKYNIENTSYQNSPFTLILKITPLTSTGLNSIELDYIATKNNRIIAHHYTNDLSIDLSQIVNIENTGIGNDIAYTVVKPEPNIKLIAFKKIGGLIKPISLFSFILSLSGIILFLLTALNTKFNFLPVDFDLKLYSTSSLRTRIQLTIVLLIIFSFITIGIVTAYYFKNVLENNNQRFVNESISTIINNIRASIEGVDNNVLAATNVQSKIEELSNVHNKKLIFFDPSGKAQQASFTAPKINRIPFDIYNNYQALNSGYGEKKINYWNKNYTLDIIPLLYKSRKPYGYIGSIYEQNNNSNRSIKDFLSTILNVYVFLFLIAGALAIAIGNSITKPLSILSKKLKDYKLGRSNQKLEWTTKDEIGKLIREYNLLTQKLDESANILARTERDMAWREMAKQVAHEIKNPLTPMKLSIQYLDRAIKSDPENAQALVERVSNTLIEQINNLNQIANEFSNFAKMPRATNEKIIVNEVVEAIHDLFRKREDMIITLNEPIQDLFVFADRNHLVRILNNIVKNAIQAIPTDRKGIIDINLVERDQKAVISIRDNGSGIPDEMKDKVFTPNFTTKSSGTGLGLAISANMIESFNGKIYFETVVGQGTTFYVEIPLMRLDNTKMNRVSLD